MDLKKAKNKIKLDSVAVFLLVIPYLIRNGQISVLFYQNNLGKKISRVQKECYQVCLLLCALANIADRRVRPYVCVIV